MKRQYSISARHRYYHIRDHLVYMMQHSNMHGGLNMQFDEISDVYGTVEDGFTPLYGGRSSTFEGLRQNGANIQLEDSFWLRDNGIGWKIPLTATPTFTDEEYDDSLEMLRRNEVEGNTIIVSIDKLAERIKNDFPLYDVELSAIRNINTKDKFDDVKDLYDMICLPLNENDNDDLLNSIIEKDKVRLIINGECSYSCPNKICYKSISDTNKGDLERASSCSAMLGIERKFYDDSVRWENYYFDVDKYDSMGFHNYKMLNPKDSAGNIRFMYKSFINARRIEIENN